MTLKRIDHVNLMVEDLPAAISFFTTLGMILEGEQPIEGDWLDRLNGLKDMKVDIALMKTPDGHNKIEITQFRNPKLVESTPINPPPNTLGLRQMMCVVDDIDDTLARLLAQGAEQIGETVQYQNFYKLCYVRGPAGIIICLTEELV